MSRMCLSHPATHAEPGLNLGAALGACGLHSGLLVTMVTKAHCAPGTVQASEDLEIQGAPSPGLRELAAWRWETDVESRAQLLVH